MARFHKKQTSSMILAFVALAFARQGHCVPSGPHAQQSGYGNNGPHGCNGANCGVQTSTSTEVRPVTVQNGVVETESGSGINQYSHPTHDHAEGSGHVAGNSVLLKGYKFKTVPWVKTGIKLVPKRFYVYGKVNIAQPYFKKISTQVETRAGKPVYKNRYEGTAHGGYIDNDKHGKINDKWRVFDGSNLGVPYKEYNYGQGYDRQVVQQRVNTQTTRTAGGVPAAAPKSQGTGSYGAPSYNNGYQQQGYGDAGYGQVNTGYGH